MKHICKENEDKNLIEYHDNTEPPYIAGFYFGDIHKDLVYYCPFCGINLSNLCIEFTTTYDEEYDILYIDSPKDSPFSSEYEGIGSNIYERIRADTESIVGYMIYRYKKQDIDKLKEILPEHVHKYLKH